jgi:hypothetical protein
MVLLQWKVNTLVDAIINHVLMDPQSASPPWLINVVRKPLTIGKEKLVHT